MERIYIVFGRPACGKTYRANDISRKYGAFLLSDDELSAELFGRIPISRRLEYQPHILSYLCKQAVRLSGMGICVCIDAGFWSKADREAARAALSGREVIWCYMDPDAAVRQRYLQRRNESIAAGEAGSNFVLSWERVCSLDAYFEEPEASEYDSVIH